MTAEQQKPVFLPYIDIQRDSQDVERDILAGEVGAEDIWCSVYQQQQKSVHGKIRCRATAEGGISYEAREGIEMDKLSNGSLLVSAASLGVKQTKVRRPKALAKGKHAQGIEAFDLSPVSANSSTSFVSGSKNGVLTFGSIDHSTGQSTLLLEPKKEHKSDITAARFFPSGQVVLTASLDTTIRLWSFDRGTNPQTLTGHARAVTSVDFLLPTQGREIISTSLDGTLRHWDVSTGGAGQLASWTFDHPVSAAVTNPSGSTAYAAIRSNSTSPVALVDLRSKQVSGNLHTPRRSSPTAIAVSADESKVATGDAEGLVTVWDTRSSTSQPLLQWERTQGAAINSLAFAGEDLLVGGADGLPYRAGLVDGAVKVLEEFSSATEEEGEKIVSIVQRDNLLVCAGGRGWAVY